MVPSTPNIVPPSLLNSQPVSLFHTLQNSKDIDFCRTVPCYLLDFYLVNLIPEGPVLDPPKQGKIAYKIPNCQGFFLQYTEVRVVTPISRKGVGFLVQNDL